LTHQQVVNSMLTFVPGQTQTLEIVFSIEYSHLDRDQ